MKKSVIAFALGFVVAKVLESDQVKKLVRKGAKKVKEACTIDLDFSEEDLEEETSPTPEVEETSPKPAPEEEKPLVK